MTGVNAVSPARVQSGRHEGTLNRPPLCETPLGFEQAALEAASEWEPSAKPQTAAGRGAGSIGELSE